MSVLSPNRAPPRLTIVLTAPARRAAGDTSSSRPITAILCGTVTLAPRIPGSRRDYTAREISRQRVPAFIDRRDTKLIQRRLVQRARNGRRDRRSRPAGRDRRMGRGRRAAPCATRRCSGRARRFRLALPGHGEGVFAGIALSHEVHVWRVVREEHRLDRGKSRVRNRTRWQPLP